MANWTFEPGHTAAEFRVRHLMVTEVRGPFKDKCGVVVGDTVHITIDAEAILD